MKNFNSGLFISFIYESFLISYREGRKRGRQNGLICLTSMLNERARQFNKAVHCKVTR